MGIFLLFVLFEKSTKNCLMSVHDAIPDRWADFEQCQTPDWGLGGLGMVARVLTNAFVIRQKY